MINPLAKSIIGLVLAMPYGWAPPIAGIVFVAASAALVSWVSQPIVPRAFEANKREGSFRFGHERFREYVEAITAMQGEVAEER